MKTITGFKDRYGVELRRRRWLTDTAICIAESFGYEPIAVPPIERAEAYNPNIVGLSPWPEWNPNGCFFFDIDNYVDTYSSPESKTAAVLIPEGTLSLTRWLGPQLTGAGTSILPMKIYYDLQCFRNELTSSLSLTKGRSFSQFGLEILGAHSISADIEQMAIAHEMLSGLGVDGAKIVFRMSCNELFLSMAEKAGLSLESRVIVKGYLDIIAECKAGKKPERLNATIKLFWSIINRASERNLDKAWEYILSRNAGDITNQDRDMLSDYSPKSVERLSIISEVLKIIDIPCEIDFCVVRSHEYYTGITFEIDFIGKQSRYVEVGGGGRYDRLLGNFTPSTGPKSVPCVGFAFGVERLQSALEAEGFFPDVVERKGRFLDLAKKSNIDSYTLSVTDSETDLAKMYVNSIVALRKKRVSGRVSVTV